MRNLILTLIIWIISFTAITAGISLTYTWYKDRGEDITISFENVEGLVPNKSKIIYLGVQVGTIQTIKLHSKTGLPLVTARVSKQSAKLLGPKSSFWIVRPELALDGIRNLGTIASGNYIGVHPVKGEVTRGFIGLEDAPTANKSGGGLHLILKANSVEGIEIGSAILYRGLKIGQVDKMSLHSDHKSVLVQLYIDNDFVNVIRKNSHFGNISGFHARLHLFGGSEIHMNSFRTLVNGAIEVITPHFNEPKIKSNDIFPLLAEDQLTELRKTLKV